MQPIVGPLHYWVTPPDMMARLNAEFHFDFDPCPCPRRKRTERTKGEPVRVDRVVEITIRDTHRPMTVIRLRREENDEGRWGRWTGIGAAHLGTTGIGKLIGKYLE